jgi:hypothetical protein
MLLPAVTVDMLTSTVSKNGPDEGVVVMTGSATGNNTVMVTLVTIESVDKAFTANALNVVVPVVVHVVEPPHTALLVVGVLPSVV